MPIRQTRLGCCAAETSNHLVGGDGLSPRFIQLLVRQRRVCNDISSRHASHRIAESQLGGSEEDWFGSTFLVCTRTWVGVRPERTKSASKRLMRRSKLWSTTRPRHRGADHRGRE